MTAHLDVPEGVVLAGTAGDGLTATGDNVAGVAVAGVKVAGAIHSPATASSPRIVAYSASGGGTLVPMR